MLVRGSRWLLIRGMAATGNVGHGLGVAPQFDHVLKIRSGGNWLAGYHAFNAATKCCYLNTTMLQAANFKYIWNNTTSHFTVFFTLGGLINGANSGSTYVAYCFAPVAGYSSFGSYTGNGSADGPFVYTGFRPRFVMIKAQLYCRNKTGLFTITARDLIQPSYDARSLVPK
jgi:hypothetical protein